MENLSNATEPDLWLKCDICGNQYKKEGFLRRHMIKVHSDASNSTENFSNSKRGIKRMTDDDDVNQSKTSVELAEENDDSKIGKLKIKKSRDTAPKDIKSSRRDFICDKCTSVFKSKSKYLVHRKTSHTQPSVEVRQRKSTSSRSVKKENTSKDMNSNDANFGEFIVDALYVSKDSKLVCCSGNLVCFSTNKILDMKHHREKYHGILESRIGYDTWKHLVPGNFLPLAKAMHNNLHNERKDEVIDVAKIVRDAGSRRSPVSRAKSAKLQSPIREKVKQYLMSLEQKYVGA